jgi:hypothetical protein
MSSRVNTPAIAAHSWARSFIETSTNAFTVVSPSKLEDVPCSGSLRGVSPPPPLQVQRIDRLLAARRTKLMRELRERIGEVERNVGPFTRDRAALWAQVETAFNVRMLGRFAVWSQ